MATKKWIHLKPVQRTAVIIKFRYTFNFMWIRHLWKALPLKFAQNMSRILCTAQSWCVFTLGDHTRLLCTDRHNRHFGPNQETIWDRYILNHHVSFSTVFLLPIYSNPWFGEMFSGRILAKLKISSAQPFKMSRNIEL